MLPAPMLGDVPAGTKPDAIPFARMIQETDQPDRLRRPTNEAIVQRETHDLRSLGALFVKQVETIDHVLREFFGRAESRIAIESIVVGFKRVGDHQVSASAEPHPRIIPPIVPVVQKSPVLDDEPPGVDA